MRDSDRCRSDGWLSRSSPSSPPPRRIRPRRRRPRPNNRFSRPTPIVSQAMVSGDVAMLDRLLAVELSYIDTTVHASRTSMRSCTASEAARQNTRASFRASGRFTSWGPSQPSIGVAVMRGEEEPGVDVGIRYTSVHVLRDGRWQMVAWQSTRIAPERNGQPSQRLMRAAGFFTLILSIGLMTLTAQSPARQPYTTWSDYGGSADSMQYSGTEADHEKQCRAAAARLVLSGSRSQGLLRLQSAHC